MKQTLVYAVAVVLEHEIVKETVKGKQKTFLTKF